MSQEYMPQTEAVRRRVSGMIASSNPNGTALRVNDVGRIRECITFSFDLIDRLEAQLSPVLRPLDQPDRNEKEPAEVCSPHRRHLIEICSDVSNLNDRLEAIISRIDID